MQINWLSIGCTSIASFAVNYVANNTPYLSKRAWKAHGKLHGLLREFNKESSFPIYKADNKWHPFTNKEAYKKAMLEWRDGTINKAMKAFKRETDRISTRSKLTPLYCGLSIGCALIVGDYITKNIGAQYDDRTRRRYETIHNVGLTALFTFSSTKSTKLTLINSLIVLFVF